MLLCIFFNLNNTMKKNEKHKKKELYGLALNYCRKENKFNKDQKKKKVVYSS